MDLIKAAEKESEKIAAGTDSYSTEQREFLKSDESKAAARAALEAEEKAESVAKDIRTEVEVNECPTPFTWNVAAKRCQRIRASGNTQFIKTRCCVDLIKAAEKDASKIAAGTDSYSTEQRDFLNNVEAKAAAQAEYEAEQEAEMIRKEAADAETKGTTVGSVSPLEHGSIFRAERAATAGETVTEKPSSNDYDTEEEEEQTDMGACSRKCYYRKNFFAARKQVSCDELKNYKGKRKCSRGGKSVDCDKVS